MAFEKAFKQLILFAFGGLAYGAVEIAARGHTHWTMIVLGGICFILIGLINEYMPWGMPLTHQMLIGCIIITTLEFATGCVVNLWLGWNVWDYSAEQWNLCGQICLKYSVYWFFISAVAIIIDDFIRWAVFEEEEPHYKFF